MIVISSFKGGGAEKVAAFLANRMNKDGYKIDVVTIKSPNDDFYSLDEGITRTVINYKNAFSYIRKLRMTIKNSSPDIIISFMNSTNIKVLIATLFSKRKVIITEHSDPSIWSKSIKNKVIQRIFYVFSDALVTVSKGVGDYFSWIPKEKKIVINNPLIIREVEKDLEKKKIILSVGRLNKVKQYKELILGFQIINNKYPDNDYCLYIVGEGPEYNDLKEIIKKNKLENRVFLEGQTILPEEYYGVSQYYISSSKNEAFGNTLIEAMYFGLVVLSTPTLGAQEIIKDKQNGLILDGFSREDIARGLEIVLKNNNFEEMQILSKNAKRDSLFYLEDNIINRWYELFSRLLK